MKKNDEKIKLIILDVDGVLTDGRLLIGSNGVEFKNFSVKDGMGISIAKYAGIEFAIITGRCSESVTIRANELGINYVYQGISDKKEVLRVLMKDLNLVKEQICYMGDDLNDIPIITEVGQSFAPSDANDFVKNIVTRVTDSRGGNGAVREMIEIILHAQYEYKRLVQDYLLNKYSIIQ